MNIKQTKLVEAIKNGATSIAEAGKIAGYSPTSMQIYKPHNRRIIQQALKAFTPEQVKADIQEALIDFKGEKDNPSRCRMVELKAKCVGIGQENNVNVVNLGIGLGEYVQSRFAQSTEKPIKKPSDSTIDVEPIQDKAMDTIVNPGAS